MLSTMIELPRAVMAADQIAQFFSFGTINLTQTGLGISHDDYDSFVRQYIEGDIFKKDPFQVIDFAGIGQLMCIAFEKGRKVQKDLKIDICGERGGEPDSVKFCHNIGLNHVSCSPFRMPIARLAAPRPFLRKRPTRPAKPLKRRHPRPDRGSCYSKGPGEHVLPDFFHGNGSGIFTGKAGQLRKNQALG